MMFAKGGASPSTWHEQSIGQLYLNCAYICHHLSNTSFVSEMMFRIMDWGLRLDDLNDVTQQLRGIQTTSPHYTITKA